METAQNTLIVITGPTGSGKTDLAINLARQLGCEIISADSRQIYAEIPITTAAPTQQQLALVPHHNVGTLPLDAYYSAAQFEVETLQLLDKLFARNRFAILCGGSMMYVDAVTRGIDVLPTISESVRHEVYNIWKNQGIEAVKHLLLHLDPEYYYEVDLNNPKRIVHAVEICIEAGKPYSSLRTGVAKQRHFRILKFALNFPRTELFDRINRRVDNMIEAGMLLEAKKLYHLRHLNSLNTVGFKEMFTYLDGKWDFDTAVARLKKNTRVYAKKQLTWLQRDPEVRWLEPQSALQTIIEALQTNCSINLLE